MITVKVDRTTDDPYGLWDAVRAEFIHVDDGGTLQGMSTGPEGIRLHFAEMPDEAAIAAICVMFDVEDVTCEEE